MIGVRPSTKLHWHKILTILSNELFPVVCYQLNLYMSSLQLIDQKSDRYFDVIVIIIIQ